MAGDWIKMRGVLCTHPKVLRIAGIIGRDNQACKQLSTGFNGCLLEIVTSNVTRDVTVASLLRVWSAANEHTSDGVWQGMHPDDLDQIAGVFGFGAAMVEVGWAIYDEEKDQTTLPNFLEYNAPAKNGSRSSSAQRQKRYRESKKQNNATEDVTPPITRNVTRDVTSDAREEKRRSKPPTPDQQEVEGLNADAWNRWVEYKAGIRKPIKPVSILAAKKKLAGFGAMQFAVVEQSIANGWQGLFDLKTPALVPDTQRQSLFAGAR